MHACMHAAQRLFPWGLCFWLKFASDLYLFPASPPHLQCTKPMLWVQHTARSIMAHVMSLRACDPGRARRWGRERVKFQDRDVRMLCCGAHALQTLWTGEVGSDTREPVSSMGL